MYVDVLSEGFRTRVRFPPPPPFFKEEALEIKGLFLFDTIQNTLSKRFPIQRSPHREHALLIYLGL